MADSDPVMEALQRAMARDLEKGGAGWRSTREISDVTGLSVGRARVLLERLHDAGEIEASQDRVRGPTDWRYPGDKPLLQFIDFDARREPKTKHFCVACQRDLRPGRPFRTVLLQADGSPFAVHPNGPKPEGARWWPIGEDCALRLGIFWTSGPSAPTGEPT